MQRESAAWTAAKLKQGSVDISAARRPIERCRRHTGEVTGDAGMKQGRQSGGRVCSIAPAQRRLWLIEAQDLVRHDGLPWVCITERLVGRHPQSSPALRWESPTVGFGSSWHSSRGLRQSAYVASRRAFVTLQRYIGLHLPCTLRS